MGCRTQELQQTTTIEVLGVLGGTIDGEESSGRTVMIPTSIIFEKEVINYTERLKIISLIILYHPILLNDSSLFLQ